MKLRDVCCKPRGPGDLFDKVALEVLGKPGTLIECMVGSMLHGEIDKIYTVIGECENNSRLPNKGIINMRLNDICKQVAVSHLGKIGTVVERMSDSFGMPSGGTYVVHDVWHEMPAIKINKSWFYATEFRKL